MLTSKHHPDGNGSCHFDNARLESLIAAYQAGTNPTALAEIVTLSQNRARALLYFNGTTRYCTEAELLSDINYKLLKAVRKFDPSRGTAFSFVSRVVTNVLATSVTNARKRADRYVELDETLASGLPANGESAATSGRDALDDLLHRIRAGVRSTLNDPGELDTQRWFVNSFCEDGFESRRHQCANAAQVVHGVSHSRSRELYDLTMLECRRELYDNLPPRPPIAVGQLLKTRAAWMARYAPLMNEVEFSKFFTLMHDLSPFCVLLVDPENRSRRQDRCAQVSRRNIEFILSGHPDAVPLFKCGLIAKESSLIRQFFLIDAESDEASIPYCRPAVFNQRAFFLPPATRMSLATLRNPEVSREATTHPQTPGGTQ